MTSANPQTTRSPSSQASIGTSQFSAPGHLPTAAATSPAPGPSSYASATKNATALHVSESANMSAAVGAPPPAQHGLSDSVNGKNPTIPAIPSVGGPTIVNGNSTNHTRNNPSMTVTPAGVTGPAANGGAVGGAQNKANNIQFGSMNAAGSPAMGTPPTLANHSSSNLSIASLNPRIASPQNSPSPIPQPVSASGGRPPSTLQGNGVSFGQMGGDTGDLNMPMRSVSQMQPQLDHMRRGSSQSDMGNGGAPAGPGRGGYPIQGGRGRGYGAPYGQQIAYSPAAQNFRPPPNGRGGYQGRQQGPYPGSPSLAPRTPNMMNSNPAGTPQMPHMNMHGPQQYGYPQVNRQFSSSQNNSVRGKPPNDRSRGPGPRSRGGRGSENNRLGYGRGGQKPGTVAPYRSNDTALDLSQPNNAPFPVPIIPTDLSPESGNFEQYLTHGPQQYMQYRNDPSIDAMHQQQLWLQQQQQMQGYPGYPPPQSPRPQFSPNPQAPYMQHQGSNQGYPPTSMSRQSSQMSGPDRPGSTVGQAPTPSMAPATAPSHGASRVSSISAPAAKSSFIVPPKKSGALVIKNSAGEIVSFNKPPASPATTAPPKSATPTPPVPTPSPKVVEPSNAHTDSVNVKTDEEKKKAMQEAVARKVAEDEAKAKQEQAEKEAHIQEAAAPEVKEPEAPKAPEAPKVPEIVKEIEAKPPVEPIEPEVEEKVEPAVEVKTTDAPPAAAEPAPPADDDEPDYDAIEAEFAAQEAEEARKEEEYQKKKAAQKELQRKKEAEEEAAYEANMKQMEREAEEREAAKEKKRLEGEAGSDDEAASKAFAMLKVSDAADPATPDSTGTPGIQTPEATDTGAATPVSDISMPPPARGMAVGKRGKASELTLITNKAVEPPEPSATLKSLTSARLLEDPTKVDYPSGIASPNPALNANAPADRKFKYNKEFLLQFQTVFKEKPSLDWDAKIKEALGDGGDSTASARGGSARTPSGMGPRNVSNRAPIANAFQMGHFAGAPGQRTTPVGQGTTSEQRFAMSTSGGMATGRGPVAANPFAMGRTPGMAMATPMGRNPSNNAMGMPGSPRVGGGSARGGSRNESKRNRPNPKQMAQENNAMPLTAGMDLNPIQVSASGWKPRSVGTMAPGPALGGDGLMAPDVVQRKVKSNLNKMTPEKFDKIADQILEIAAQSKDESDGRTLRQVIQLTFEKATDEAHWAPMYAMFCKRMLESMNNDIKDENIKDKNDNVVTGGNLFRKYLLNRCQEEFEKGWKVNLPEKEEGQTEEAAMLSEEYYIAAAAKRRGLGLVRFIGELFKLGMLTERIMHECVKKLLDYDGIPDEAEVESLTSLLRTVGANLDDPNSKGHPRMEAYFERINQIMNMPDLPSRLRFMLLDVIDLRKHRWHSKQDDKGPKTIQQIHAEAQEAQQRAEASRLAQQANRGGGRMASGRGDARFGGGYGQQMPPPDNSNRVSANELRNLQSRAPRNASNTGGPGGAFGPTSLLAGRTNSGRRGLGPGGNLFSREDSGNSSRTGTPPAQKEDKKNESSNNAFSALAALESQEAPASPPSASSSPPTQKSRPANERERSKSPDKSKE